MILNQVALQSRRQSNLGFANLYRIMPRNTIFRPGRHEDRMVTHETRNADISTWVLEESGAKKSDGTRTSGQKITVS